MEPVIGRPSLRDSFVTIVSSEGVSVLTLRIFVSFLLKEKYTIVSILKTTVPLL